MDWFRFLKRPSKVEKVKGNKWKPALKAHRRRASVKVVTEEERKQRTRVGISLKLISTYQAGEQSFFKTFIADKNQERLSARETIL